MGLTRKDPIGAAICALEFVGPCRFGGWREDGTPIVVENPDAWVQIQATTADQTKNTMILIAGIFTAECKMRHGIDAGKTVIYAYGGARRIEVTSSNAAALEGNRPSFILKSETHHWKASNGGIDLDAVDRRNLAKSEGGQARSLAITNAHKPGEKSIGERQRVNYLEIMESRGFSTLLYDSLEAPKGATLVPTFTRWDESGREITDYAPDGSKIMPSLEVTREYLRRILTVVRGDAVWLDVDRLASEILSGEYTIEEAKRFYFNAVDLGDDASFDPDDIRATANEEIVAARRSGTAGDPMRAGWVRVDRSDPIVIFGDGSKSNDSTGLIGCRLSDGYVFTIGVWQKPKGDRGRGWLAPRHEVDARVHEAFARFNVVAFWFDPSHTKDDDDDTAYWDTLIDEWHLAYADRLQYWAVTTGERRSAIMWDMTSPVRQANFVLAVAQFTDDLESHSLEHDGHPSLVDHLTNARRSMTAAGLSLSKASRSSSKKIDLAVCAIGARMLRRVLALKGLEEQKKKAGAAWGGAV